MSSLRAAELTAEEIKKYCDACVKVFDSVTSTNDICKNAGINGESEYTVFLARSQTAGKGRLGRSFYSPHGSGIYMSILLCPSYDDERLRYLTAMAAVAVAEAIDEVTKAQSQIKWVNDVYIEDRKCVGILTESVSGGGRLNVAIGVGINVTEPKNGFPQEISDRAGAVAGDVSAINELAGKAINNILREYREFDKGSLLRRYRERCITVGHEVTVVSGSAETPAYCLRVNDDFGLDVEYKDGTVASIFTGEVSVRI